MAIARKVGAVVIMVLAALVFVGCIAGIGGAWYLRSVVYNEVRQVADQALELTETVDTGVARIESRLNAVLQLTQTVRQRTEALAARDLSDTALNSAVRSLGALLLEELSPAIERVSDAVETVSDRIEALNRLIRVANRLTGSDLPTIEPSEMAIVTDTVANARTNIATAQSRVATARVETRQEIAADITRLTTSVDAIVQPIQQRVTTMRTRLGALEERIETLPGRLDARLLLPVALVATLLLLWLAVGQLALLWLGWLLFLGRFSLRAGLPSASDA
jgi:hypothetical protein